MMNGCILTIKRLAILAIVVSLAGACGDNGAIGGGDSGGTQADGGIGGIKDNIQRTDARQPDNTPPVAIDPGAPEDAGITNPPHSSDASIASDSSIPTTGTLPCKDVSTCINDQCTKDDNACQQKCYYSGTTQAQKEYLDYANCMAKTCPSIPCTTATNCAAAAAQCYVGPTPGGIKSCAQLFICMQNCTDSACIEACYAQGTAKAVQQSIAVQLCISGLCGDGSDACEDQAAKGLCKTHIYECYEVPAAGTEPAGVSRDTCTGTATSTGTAAGITPTVASGMVNLDASFIGALGLTLFPNFATAGSNGLGILFYPKVGQLDYAAGSVMCSLVELGAPSITKAQAQSCELHFTKMKHATAPKVCSGTLTGTYRAVFPNNQVIQGAFYLPSYIDETMLLTAGP